MHRLSSRLTTWHITWGTYGARLHGSARPTVDRRNAEVGDRFVQRNEKREGFETNIMVGDAVYLCDAQRCFVESTVAQLCQRGGWTLRTCAAGIEGERALASCGAALDAEGVEQLGCPG